MMDKEKLMGSIKMIYKCYVTAKKRDVDILRLLSDIKLNNLVQYYIHNKNKLTEIDINTASYIIKILQEIYNNSDKQSPISDEDYDNLYEIMLDYTGNHIIGADNPRNKKIVHHKYPDLRGTLDKVHFITNYDKGDDSRKSIEGWETSIEQSVGRKLTASEREIDLFPKFDGVSVIFECDKDGNVERALTRGNVETNEAIDLTELFKNTKFEPIFKFKDSEFGVKTEVVMSSNDFDILCKQYGSFNNPRSAVSSIINSNELDQKYLEFLTIIPLRVQSYNTKEIIIHPSAYTDFPYLQYSMGLQNDMNSAFNTIKDRTTDMMGLPTDGIVIVLREPNIRKTLGRSNHINKYEVAYKFPPESKKTKLLDVEFCIGILGSVTPVAKIESVKINGNKISNVSLGSMDRFESLKLRKGDEVVVKYEIIPYLVKDKTCESSKGKLIVAPTRCEYCGHELKKDPVLKCVNDECPSRVIGKVVNYIEKMSIPNISIATVTTFFKNGFIKSIADLYRLKKHKSSIISLDGFGQKSFKNIVNGIKSRKTVFDYDLLGSIGIPDIGRRMFKKILSLYTMNELIDLCKNNSVSKLTSIHGIKDKTANKIIRGIISNIDLIKFLEKELDVKRDNNEYRCRVLFSKVRDGRFENYLESINVQILDNYSKDVDIIIVKNLNDTSSKIDKGRKDGKKIITLEDAYKIFDYVN